MVDYAVVLTKDPNSLAERNIAKLRKNGMNEEEILHLALVMGYFNFVKALSSGSASLEEKLGTEY